MAITSSSRSPSPSAVATPTASTLQPRATRPFGLRFRSSTSFILVVVGFSLFSDFFLYGIIVPVLPFALKERINLPDANVQTTISILLAVEALASVIASPLAGLLADFGNARLTFLGSLVALLGSTGLLCFGRTLALLILARVLQGTSAAVVWTVGLALVSDTVGPHQLGRVFSTMHSLISLGSLASPSIGGIVYARFGYYAVYVVSGAVVVIDIVLRLLVVERHVAKKFGTCPSKPGTDEPDERTVLLPAERPTPSSPAGWASTQSGLARYFPLVAVLGDRSLMGCMLVCLTQASLLASFDATLPLHVHATFGLGSLGSGLLFCVLQLTLLLSAPLFGWWADLHGGRGCVVLGSFALVPLLALLGLPAGQGVGLGSFVALLAGIGIGQAAIGAPGFVEANTIVRLHYEAAPDQFGPKGPYGQLYAINNVMFGIGMTVGPLVSAWLVEAFNYNVAMNVLALQALLTGVMCFRWMKPRERTAETTEGVEQ